jgi:8-oxo-dGTP pyrophosphatase MutT (NUDIX family)
VSNQNFNTANVIDLLHQYTPRDQDEKSEKKRLLHFVTHHADFYSRSLLIGHVTASAWVTNTERSLFLLNHHARLDRWMQVGGHIEDDPDIQSAALREAAEESGLSSITLAGEKIFDVDIHEIPETPAVPAHLHYDIRFLVTADSTEPIQISNESKSLEWCDEQTVRQRSSEWSVIRMLEKSLAL